MHVCDLCFFFSSNHIPASRSFHVSQWEPGYRENKERDLVSSVSFVELVRFKPPLTSFCLGLLPLNESSFFLSLSSLSLSYVTHVCILSFFHQSKAKAFKLRDTFAVRDFIHDLQVLS